LGGPNWAFCELPEPGSGGEVKSEFKVYVMTPNINGAGAIG